MTQVAQPKYTDQQISEAIEYFTEFQSSLLTYLHPHKSKLGNSFSGIAKGMKTIQLSFCEIGFFARLLPIWRGCNVEVGYRQQYSNAAILKYKPKSGKHRKLDFICSIQGAFIDKDMFGIWQRDGSDKLVPCFEANFSIRLFVEVENTAIRHALPLVLKNSTGENHRNKKIDDLKMIELAGKDFKTAFLYQWATNRSDILEGLDPEPKSEAYAFSEVILERCGLLAESNEKKYTRLKNALEIAIDTDNTENEKKIHEVIEKNSSILVDDPDIDEFYSEHTLNYTEIVKNGGEISEEKRSIRPDFIYKLSSDEFVFIEIEAASKNLLLQTQESSFNVFSAKANKALAQIRNYKTVIDQHGRAEICKQLGCPSTTTFRFLLIVGSAEQKNFNERSWDHATQQLSNEGIELRHWGYYLNRLERRRNAS
ncbi:Shedu anti-phage system protein SduA domain-containing protein [Roseibium album]|uniref:Shedu anti-phage system protein SduA domain-containing protein n=1 Tax=Roseibium album TaxID=311410 RepID=UPI00248F9B5E|nr:Shedu anti-phage system protein SduA domain-containing protein [Roseibium album]